MKICKVLLVSVSHCLNVCSHTRTRTVGGERERERERTMTLQKQMAV